jgi:acyl-CoA reductase-like NAD-dependent aldehyde dehydrogenase
MTALHSQTSSETRQHRARMLIDGQWREAAAYRPVVDPYRRTVIGEAPESSQEDLEAALSAAVRAKADVARTPAHERAALLRRLAALVVERAEAVSQLMVRETGKPIKDARIEVARCEGVLTLSAEEAVRIEGAQVPLDATASGAGKLAVMWRFPVGVVAAITPYNAPFNLAWHKIAPALAAGNSVVLKAPPQAALVVHELSRILADAGVPRGWVNFLYGQAVGPALVKDPRVDFITFTGSSAVGAQIKANSGLRRVALELGGTGPTLIHADADIDNAAPLCSLNSMRLAGQSCLSVQNIYVHESRYEAFAERFVQQVRQLKVGDPADPATDVGALIDEAAARRVESWVHEAVGQGARMLTGGKRDGAQFHPTVLTDVTHDMRVVKEEIFGPVAVLHRYSDLDATLERINDSPYGLHCGIFTTDMQVAFRAIRALRFGGVVVNGSSTWRTDQMPYGGIKNSGIGREGPRYAIQDMTDERLVIFNL